MQSFGEPLDDNKSPASGLFVISDKSENICLVKGGINFSIRERGGFGT